MSVDSPAWRKARQAVIDAIDVIQPSADHLRRLARMVEVMQAMKYADARRSLHGERVWPRKPGRDY